MKKLFLSVLFIACATWFAQAQQMNTLSKKEKKEGWVLLFDGKTFDGWRGYNMTEMPKDEWQIVDGTMYCAALARDGKQGIDLVYKKTFKDFELYLEWNISEGGNSGVHYRGIEIADKPLHYSAPELQIVDNADRPGSKPNDKHKAGALFDLIPAVPQNALPAGQWNSAKILVKDQKVIHYQNGVQVCEFTIGTPEWREMCANSKFRRWEPFVNVVSEGYIGLQDHGYEVWFRNIKIREL